MIEASEKANASKRLFNQFDAPNLGEWTASEISLVKSSLSLRGSCYTIKRSFLL